MRLPALATRCANVNPTKGHVALPLFIMAALYWLSSIPGTPTADDPAIYGLFYWVSPTLQNTLHVPAYAVLAAAWRWALRAWMRASNARALVACAFASVYGVLDEWHQSFVPGRYASLTDVMLDRAGAVLGVWLIAWASRYAAKTPGR
jgi:hypothetical protein